MPHNRLLKARRLAVASETRAVDALPRLSRQALRTCALRQARGNGYARRRTAKKVRRLIRLDFLEDGRASGARLMRSFELMGPPAWNTAKTASFRKTGARWRNAPVRGLVFLMPSPGDPRTV